jgi:hypothetical protein
MTELHPAVRPSANAPSHDTIVEVWEDGHFIAAIYPIDRGVKIVSKYFGANGEEELHDFSFLDLNRPPALHVHIWDRRLAPEPPA